MQAQRRVERTIIASPLSPALLREIGGWNGPPPTASEFKADGAWVQTYRIYTCHGYRESGNEDRGVLRLERAPRPSEGFALRIEQRILQDAGAVSSMPATSRFCW